MSVPFVSFSVKIYCCEKRLVRVSVCVCVWKRAGGRRGDKETKLESALLFPFNRYISLSLSLTHTHTHARARARAHVNSQKRRFLVWLDRLDFLNLSAYHRAFRTGVQVRHPSLRTFLRHLKDMQSNSENQMEAAENGEAPPRRRRKWRLLEARLLNLRNQYNAGVRNLDNF